MPRDEYESQSLSRVNYIDDEHTSPPIMLDLSGQGPDLVDSSGKQAVYTNWESLEYAPVGYGESYFAFLFPWNGYWVSYAEPSFDVELDIICEITSGELVVKYGIFQILTSNDPKMTLNFF